VATVQEWLVSAGIDPSGFDSGLTRMLASEQRFIKQFEAAGGQIDGKAFTAGIAAGVGEGIREVERQLLTLPAALRGMASTISEDLALATADFKSGAIRAEDFAQALATARTQAQALGAPLGSLGGAATGSTRGIGTLRSGFIQLGLSAVDARGPLGALLNGILAFGAGGAVGAGIAAGLAGIAAIIGKIEEPARKAREEIEKLQDAMLHIREANDPIGTARATFEKLQGNVAAIATEMGKVTDLAPRFDRFGEDVTAGNRAQFSDLTGKLTRAVQDMNTAKGVLNDAIDKAAEEGVGVTPSDLDRVDALTKRLDAARALNLDTTGIVARLASEYDRAAAAVQKQGGPLKANLDTLEAEQRAAKALGSLFALARTNIETIVQPHIAFRPAVAPVIPTAFEDVASQITDQAKAFERAEAQLALALRSGLGVSAAQQQFEAAGTALDRATASAIAFGEALGLEPTGLVDALDAVLPGDRQLKAATTDAKKLATALNQIADVAVGLSRVVDGIQGISDAAKDAISVVAGLADATARIATGDVIGGSIQAFGSLLGGLFGGGDDAQLKATQANTDALAAATLAFKGIDKNAALSANLVAAVLDPAIQKQFNEVFGQGLQLPGRFKDLDAMLATFHTSVQEILQLAKANGIELLDEKGRLAGNGLDALAVKLQGTLAALSKFSDTVAGLGQFLTLQDQLQGKTSPLDTLQRDRQQLDKLFPDQKAFLDSLNLSTKAGQEALRKFLLDTNQAFEDGTIDVTKLRGSIDDFTAVAGDSASALNALNDAATSAASSMLNVPTGFKLAADQFKAALDQDADRLTKSLSGPNIQIGTLGPGGPPLTPNFATRTGPSVGTFNVILQAGAIVAAPGETGESLFDRVLDAARLKARSQTGDTLQLGSPF
jgi:predicted  nucleic acid-binding Zn-ribbon protein